MYLTITNVFHFPQPVNIIYSKTLDWIQVNKYIIEEEKQDDYIKFRIVDYHSQIGDYGRTSSILFSINGSGTEIKANFPRPKADDVPFRYPYYLHDIMLSLYQHLYGEPTKSVFREIYPLDVVSKSLNTVVLESIGISSPWLIALFLFLINDSFYIFFSVMLFLPWFVFMRPEFQKFRKYYKIKKIFDLKNSCAFVCVCL